jgi:hypothetical protein
MWFMSFSSSSGDHSPLLSFFLWQHDDCFAMPASRRSPSPSVGRPPRAPRRQPTTRSIVVWKPRYDGGRQVEERRGRYKRCQQGAERSWERELLAWSEGKREVALGLVAPQCMRRRPTLGGAVPFHKWSDGHTLCSASSSSHGCTASARGPAGLPVSLYNSGCYYPCLICKRASFATREKARTKLLDKKAS